MEFVWANFEWFLIGFMVVEKVIRLTPSKRDDIILDMILKPIWNKFLAKRTT